RRSERVPVRHAGAALVERDDPAERGEPLEEPARERILPHHVDVRDPPGDEDEIERTVAEDLIGDVDVAALRVARLGVHDHRPCSGAALAVNAASGAVTSAESAADTRRMPHRNAL